MSQLTPELAQAIHARIRYYRDLGVHDLYRRCEPAAELPALSGAPSFADRGPQRAGGWRDGLEERRVGSNIPELGSNSQETTSISTIPEPEPTIPARKVTPPPPSLVISTESLASADRPAALKLIQDELVGCTRCPLAFQGRHTIVFGDGNPDARLMFIGEGPGADEDAQGLPFVGRAGQLLNNMIAAMGLKRSDVYIANIVKCRPPQNRVPEPEEANTCAPFLFRQIDAIRPKVIVALGATAATYLLGGKSPLARLRGRLHEARGAKLIVTYHPAYLLRDPTQKKEAWKDLQMAMAELDLKATKPSSNTER